MISKQKRIESIDILRGLVMVIMALDHVRDYFHITSNVNNPLDFATTSPILFFTRWITHFCAPVFVFLSGTSIYLQSLRKSKKELSSFLIKRGLWLILIEVAVISFAWSFNPHYNFLFLQVIWAIGISMVLLGFLIYLPLRFVMLIGLIIVLGHNMLDVPEAAAGFNPGFWWDLMHHGSFKLYSITENHSVFMVYPFVPWTGVMMLGYCFGIYFTSSYTVEQRRKKLLSIGGGLILFFIVLRYLNIYGDPVRWSLQKNNLFTFLSFLNVYKYPPSLLYLCMTIGPALLFLAFIEKTKNEFTNVMRVFGRVAFFYYIIHLYLIHFLSTISFFGRGHSFSEVSKIGEHLPFYFVIPGEGYRLAVVYLIWVLIVIALFPLCKWYDDYKTKYKEKWWLSYL